MPASVLTLYASNPIQAGSNAGLLTPTAPAVSTSTTGWTVGTTVAARYSRQTYGQEKAAATFTSTAQPSGSPLGSAEDCWRISAATTGQFSAGTWYSSLTLIAVTAGGSQDGRARFRLWKSANADGTTATELTQGAMVGTTVTNLSTTVAQSSSASTQIAVSGLTSEYLFMQVAWEITGAATNTNRDVLIRLGSLSDVNGSGLVTPLFTTPAAGGAPPGTGYYTNYYKALVGDLL